jgi:hypothetical protein
MRFLPLPVDENSSFVGGMGYISLLHHDGKLNYFISEEPCMIVPYIFFFLVLMVPYIYGFVNTTLYYIY